MRMLHIQRILRTKMKICLNCGNMVKDDEDICDKCFSKIEKEDIGNSQFGVKTEEE